MPVNDANTRRSGRITRFVPLGWTVIALVIQLILIIAIVPTLPATVSVYLVGRVSSGSGVYSLATSDLVTVVWVVLAIAAVVSIVLAIRRSPTSWSFPTAVVTAALLATVLGLLLGSVLPQIGGTGPVAGDTDSGRVWAVLGLIVGLALGLVSVLALPRKLSGEKRQSATEPAP